ncbi:MAG: hypothetical protein ACRDV6_09820 [Acidimicrobiales bacterium]
MILGPQRPDLKDLVEVPRFLGATKRSVHPLSGVGPTGASIVLGLETGWTVLLFLSSSCDGCHELWDLARTGVLPGVKTRPAVVAVAKETSESPLQVAALGGDGTLLSDRAWSDYQIHSGPFFVVVDGPGRRIATEGVAWSVAQITAAVAALGPPASP